MRRYELMLIMRSDLPDDQAQAIIERVTRSVVESSGQLVKVNPWGRRRLAYSISGNREGSYFLILFDADPGVVAEIERSLNITEEVLRHLVVRVDRPAAARRAGAEGEEEFEAPPEEEEEEPDGEFIDESESEAAPAATDR
jgi:small subunit ribosomal protein S6